MKAAQNGNEFNSVILGECETILKNEYNINEDLPLIIVKFIGEAQTFKFEVYDPITKQKLNLSYCEDTNVDVYVPLNLSEDSAEIYNNLLDQGYDPFDLNDKFYREICTPYTSENGTDVLLDDREEFVYSSLVNATLCPDGCDYSEYSLDNKYIKCECGTNNTDIVTLDLDNLNVDNTYKSFLSTMKSTNYKVMICYNLVFNFKIFCHNYGSILTLIIFLAYVGFMIYYCVKDISPVKLNISKILFSEQEKIKENLKKSNFAKNAGKKQKVKVKFKEKGNEDNVDKIDIDDINYPPKKGKITKKKTNLDNLETESIKFVKDTKSTKPKSKKKYNKDLIPKNLIKANDTKSEVNRSAKHKKIDIFKKEENSLDKFTEEKEKQKNKNLDNFELNNLIFYEACELDKRTFCTTYLSVLMREHIALVTFAAWKDYNLFYVKIEKFFIIFCTEMTMNGLFFVHESMHKKYTTGEDFTFVQKIPQLLFTLLVSHAIEVLLCFLCMTDVHVYEIKALPVNDRNNGEKIMNILDKIRRKLVAFFVVTFLLGLFYWYFISAFCAVYQNTQKIFIRDTFISFAISLIDPFIIYGITCLLRLVSLTLCCRKNCCGKVIYKISDLIPFF